MSSRFLSRGLIPAAWLVDPATTRTHLCLVSTAQWGSRAIGPPTLRRSEISTNSRKDKRFVWRCPMAGSLIELLVAPWFPRTKSQSLARWTTIAWCLQAAIRPLAIRSGLLSLLASRGVRPHHSTRGRAPPTPPVPQGSPEGGPRQLALRDHFRASGGLCGGLGEAPRGAAAGCGTGASIRTIRYVRSLRLMHGRLGLSPASVP
jgi:hypothetical protein